MILLDKLIQFFCVYFCVCVCMCVCLFTKADKFFHSCISNSLQVTSKGTEIQKSYDQVSTGTFTAKGSQSGQQCTPMAVGASDDQVIIYEKR